MAVFVLDFVVLEYVGLFCSWKIMGL